MKTLLFAFLLFGITLAFQTTIFELDGNPTSNINEDWQTLFAGGGTSKSYSGVKTDPSPLSIYRTGGSKDTNDIPDWKHGDGSVPDKNDILNAYAAAYVDNGEVYIFFGADRYSNDGDSSVGFWFFQEEVQLLDDGTFAGVHRNGDILVLANFGQTQTIEVWEWKDGEVVLVYSDLNGRCNNDPAQTVCAIANDVDVTSPWPYVPKSGVSGVMPPDSFVEGAINLVSLFQTLDNIPCFTSFMAVTRSSTSITSQLKDFVVNEFELCSMGLVVDCYNASIDDTKTAVQYDVNITVVNDGFGDLYELTVDYNELNIFTQAVFAADEEILIQQSFTTDGTEQPVAADSVYAKAFKTMALDGFLDNFVESATCPLIDLVPDATLALVCSNVTIDEVNEKYLYDFEVEVINTGFGNLTVYELLVNGVAPGGLGTVLTPTGSTNTLVLSSVIESDVPIDSVSGAVNFLTFEGLTLVREDTSEMCPTPVITPSINVTKTCEVSLEVFEGKVVTRVFYSGEICNDGNIRLKNVELHENVAGLGDQLVTTITSLEKGVCVDYSDDYYPNAFDETKTFTDQVTVTADAILNLGQFQDTDEATCGLCP